MWRHKALAYHSSFAGLCEGAIPLVLDRAGVQPGANLLDVGCGDGRLAKAAVDRDLSVTACDPDPGMRALATTTAHGNAVVLDAGLPDLDGIGDSAFDAAVANFVINHLSDPRAALRGLRRVLHRGGRIVFTIWTEIAAPHVQALGEALDRIGAPAAAGLRLPPDLDFPRTLEGMGGIARTAGLCVDSVEEITWTWQVAPDSLWTGFLAGIGSRSERFAAQSPATQTRVRELTTEALASYLDEGTYWLPCAAGLCVAHRV